MESVHRNVTLFLLTAFLSVTHCVGGEVRQKSVEVMEIIFTGHRLTQSYLCPQEDLLFEEKKHDCEN